MEWTWRWVPTQYGASWGDNPFFDWVRVICVVSGVVLMCVIGRILVEQKRREVPMPPTQTARFIALALADVSISFTEIAVAGTPATPRLAVNVLVMLTGIYGVWGMRQKQRRNPPVR